MIGWYLCLETVCQISQLFHFFSFFCYDCYVSFLSLFEPELALLVGLQVVSSKEGGGRREGGGRTF